MHCRKTEPPACGCCTAGGSTGAEGLTGRGCVRLSTGKGAVDHPFKHRDERVGGKRVMNVGEALLPALRLQQRQRGIARGP